MIRLIYMLKRTAIAMLMCAVVVGCKDEKEIPEEDLINIFHDAFIANAYLTQQGAIPNDSVIVYEPILEKYGYTVEEFQRALEELSLRKSARVSDLLTKASERLEAEAAIEKQRIVVLDTIENIAKREYTRVLHYDSLIHVKRLKDTTKLRISVKDIVPGDYTVSFKYNIDTLDKNRNSRVELYLLKNDTIELKRHTQMLVRYREGTFTRVFNVDTVMSELYINMFYHPKNETSETPNIKIEDLKVVRVLPIETSVDSLYSRELQFRIFDMENTRRLIIDTISPIKFPTIALDTLNGNTIEWFRMDPMEWYRARHHE